MKIIQLTFDKILPIWEEHLWPNRDSKIKSMSSITFHDTIDMSIYKNIPSFFGLTEGGEYVGVISGFSTSKIDYRCRGIYIFPKYRGKNLSKLLFHLCLTQAIKEERNRLWSLPRKIAYPAYKSFGFERVTSWTDKYEFGPNCFVEYVIEE